MIQSIVMRGMHHIGTDQKGKFNIGDIKTSIKEVPFVRYRFEHYTAQEIAYIKRMMGQFDSSTHLVEVSLSDQTHAELSAIADQIEDIAVFIYVPIINEEVESEKLSIVNQVNLESIKNDMYDRIMLKDLSSTLYVVSANMLKSQISAITGFESADIGICSSPLSFGPECCLTAVRARELATLYSKKDDGALPSSNHECMGRCGCIRYSEINSDIMAPPSKQKAVKTPKIKAPAAPKKKVIKGIRRL